jgi:hypothetical protein
VKSSVLLLSSVSWDDAIKDDEVRGTVALVLYLCQRVNTATSSPADDVHHYVIHQMLLRTNRFYFQHTSGTHVPVGKRKGCLLSGRSPAP